MLTWQQLHRLANEVTTLSDWMIMRDFANQIYGEGKVAKLEIETYAQSDDEGGSSYYIEDITVKDAEGYDALPDYTLPFFQSDLWNDEDEDEGEDEDNEDDDEDETDNYAFIRRFKEVYCYDDEKKGSWLLWEDLPCEKYTNTYDLATMPPLSFTVEPILSSFSPDAK